MIITYALPLAIFVSTVSTAHAALVKDFSYLIVLVLAMVGFYGAVFLLCRFVFHRSLGVSALAALAASAPNGPFIGMIVLGYLYGSASNIDVAISGVLIYLTVAPATVILLSLDSGRDQQGSVPEPNSLQGAPSRGRVAGKIIEALKAPVVWLPVLGFVLVLMGISVSKLITASLALLAHSATGVALFASGVLLAGYKVRVSVPILSLVFVKNIVQPALVWFVLHLLRWTNPLLGEAVIMAALPVLVLVVMLAVQYQILEKEMASILFISTVVSPITVSTFILLTNS
jgi:hypothetical protein